LASPEAGAGTKEVGHSIVQDETVVDGVLEEVDGALEKRDPP